MSKEKANSNQPAQTQNNPSNPKKLTFLEPIDQNKMNGVDPSDPQFLAKLNQNLPPNQEIRVKRIYHVNKPITEPEPEPIVETNVEETNKSETEEETESEETESESTESNLSGKSNPASVVRKNTKMKVPLRKMPRYRPVPVPMPMPMPMPMPVAMPAMPIQQMPLPYHYCPLCDMNMRRRSVGNLHSSHGSYDPMHFHALHDAHPRSESHLALCSICNSQLYKSNENLNRMPSYRNSQVNNNSYYDSYASTQPLYSLPSSRLKTPYNLNNQPLLPPITSSNMQQPNSFYPYMHNSDPISYGKIHSQLTASAMNSNNYRQNNNKTPNGYREIYQNRNKMIDYTYNKFNPRNSVTNGDQSKVVRVYKSPV